MGTFDFNELFGYEYLYARNGDLPKTLNIQVEFPLLRVLDLSSNNIENLSFLSYMPVLKHLFLTHNKITSLMSMPNLKELESLILGNNSISEWDGPALPKLRAFSAPNNRIKNFQNVKSFEELDSLDLSDNPIVEINKFKEIAIALFSKLRSLNRELLSDETLENAANYRGTISESVLLGLLIPYEEEFEEFEKLKAFSKDWLLDAQRQISKGTPFHLLNYCFDCQNPVEEEEVRFFPVFKVDTNQDYSVEALGMGFLEINVPEGKWSKIVFEKNDHLASFDVVAEEKLTLLVPVGPHSFYFANESGRSEVISADVNQVPSEGSSFKIEIVWYNGTVGTCYTAVFDDISTTLGASLVFKQHTNKLISFEDTTGEVLAGKPYCSSLDIIGTVMEGETIEATSSFKGGIEGESRFEWRLVIDPSENIEDAPIVGTGKSYKIACSDYSKYLVLSYTPVRNDGVEGISISKVSSQVESKKPSIFDIVLSEKFEQDQPSSVSYSFTGGIEGECTFQWLVEEDGVFKLLNGAISKDIIPGEDQVGKRLKCVATPVNTDGKIGDTVEVISNVVAPAPPAFVDVSVESEKFAENDSITVHTTYYGGFEGNSEFEFFRVDENGEEKIEHANGKKYQINLSDVRKEIKIVCTPVRSDGIKGESVEVKTPKIEPDIPRISEPTIEGVLTIGALLKVHYKYEGGTEGLTIINWYRSCQLPTEIINSGSLPPVEEISFDQMVAEQTPKYTVKKEDIGCMFKVEITPVRDDMAKGEKVVAFTSTFVDLPVPKIENVKIRYEGREEGAELSDGCTLLGESQYSSITEESLREHKWHIIDGTSGECVDSSIDTNALVVDETMFNKKFRYLCRSTDNLGQQTLWTGSDLSPLVIPSKPYIESISLMGQLVEEGNIHVKDVKGKGFDMVYTTCEWYRVSGDQEEKVTSGINYHISLEDIGCRLKLVITPKRTSPYTHIIGKPFEQITEEVQPAKPEGTCKLVDSFVEGETIKSEFTYSGGFEGESRFILSVAAEGRESEVVAEGVLGAELVSYCCRTQDIGKQILLEFFPTRQDGVVGEKVSFKSAKVEGALPCIKSLQFKQAKNDQVTPLEDGVLQAESVYYGGIEGSSMKRWRRLDGSKSEVVAIDTMQYSVTTKDIGKVIQLEYLPIRNDGVKGKEAYIRSNPVQAHNPSIKNVVVTGNSIVGGKLSVSGEYYGGIEGKSIIQWLISFSGVNGPFVPLSQFDNSVAVENDGKGSSVVLSHKCLMGFIKAQYTPVRNDNVKGTAVESNVVEVGLDKSIKEKLIHAISQSTIIEFCEGSVIEVSSKHLAYGDQKPSNKEKWTGEQLPVAFVAPNSVEVSFKKKGNVKFTSKEALYLYFLVQAFQLFSTDTSASLFGEPFSTAWKKGKNIPEEFKNITVNVPSDFSTRDDVKIVMFLLK